MVQQSMSSLVLLLRNIVIILYTSLYILVQTTFLMSSKPEGINRKCAAIAEVQGLGFMLQFLSVEDDRVVSILAKANICSESIIPEQK